MKSLLHTLAGISLGASALWAQPSANFTNFFMQTEILEGGLKGPEETVYISPEGTQLSPIVINPGGALFELFTKNNVTLESFILDHKYVSAKVPMAEIEIVTWDKTAPHRRTRADMPFDVIIKADGIIDQEDASASIRAIRFKREVQSYGADGNIDTIDRNQRTLLQEVYLDEEKTYRFTVIPEVPVGSGESVLKARGEETYSAFNIEGDGVQSSQLASMFVQVWPVADGSISGITNDETLRFNTPQLTFTYNDLYPNSTSLAYIYPGPATPGNALNMDAIAILGSGPTSRPDETSSFSSVVAMDKWDIHIDKDGPWTVELRTNTPFGVDRLAYVTFEINRSIEVQGSVTTSE